MEGRDLHPSSNDYRSDSESDDPDLISPLPSERYELDYTPPDDDDDDLRPADPNPSILRDNRADALPSFLGKEACLYRLGIESRFLIRTVTILAFVSFLCLFSFPSSGEHGPATNNIPALEIYDHRCPPTFLYHSSAHLDLNPIIGLPPRLFPSWNPPQPLVEAQRRKLSACWHPDKSQRHCKIAKAPNGIGTRLECNVTREQQTQIFAFYKTALEFYRLKNSTIRGVKAELRIPMDPDLRENPFWTSSDGGFRSANKLDVGYMSSWKFTQAYLEDELPGYVRGKPPWISEDKYFKDQIPVPVQVLFNTSLPYFRSSCALECTTYRILQSYFFLAFGSLPRSLNNTTGLTEQCECYLGLRRTLSLTWQMTPPQNHPAWADPVLYELSRNNWFWWMVRHYGAGGRSNEELIDRDPCLIYKMYAKKGDWEKRGWATEMDFWQCEGEHPTASKKQAGMHKRAIAESEYRRCLEIGREFGADLGYCSKILENKIEQLDSET